MASKSDGIASDASDPEERRSAARAFLSEMALEKGVLQDELRMAEQEGISSFVVPPPSLDDDSLRHEQLRWMKSLELQDEDGESMPQPLTHANVLYIPAKDTIVIVGELIYYGSFSQVRIARSHDRRSRRWHAAAAMLILADRFIEFVNSDYYSQEEQAAEMLKVARLASSLAQRGPAGGFAPGRVVCLKRFPNTDAGTVNPPIPLPSVCLA